MKKYPKRKHYYKWDMCECGHDHFDHSSTHWGLGWWRGKCEDCMCPKYNFDRVYKERIK